MILSTTTAGSSPKENYDFFPLTVDVEEKMYAAGKIPGSFFRREGRPSSEAILACRIIDRPLRPLFPHTLRNEVQVVETVLAVNPDDAYDVVALNAASASTMISGLPFEGRSPACVCPDRRPVGRLPALERARTRRVRNRGRRPRCRERRRRHRHDRSRCRQERMHLIYDEGQTKPGRGSRRRPVLKPSKPVHQGDLRGPGRAQEDRREGNQGIPALPGVHRGSVQPASTRSPTPTSTKPCPSPKSCRARTASTRSRKASRPPSPASSPTWKTPRRNKEIGNAFRELQRQIVRRRS